MRVYLISNRSALFPPNEPFSEAEAARRLCVLAERAAEAGIDYFQLREKDLSARLLHDLAVRLVAVLKGTGTRLLVNDRFDIALAAGASGVHLTTGSIDARVLRPLVPKGFLIGVSVHDEPEIERAEGAADFAVCGPVFETPGKLCLGLDRFSELVVQTSLPLLALGGVTADNAARLRAAGAAGYAGIRLFTQTDDYRDLVSRLKK